MNSSNKYSELGQSREGIFQDFAPELDDEARGPMLDTLMSCLEDHDEPDERLADIPKRISPSDFVKWMISTTDKLYTSIRSALEKYDISWHTDLHHNKSISKKVVGVV